MCLVLPTEFMAVPHYRECLDRLNQAKSNTPAPCHSRVTTEKSSNPPQVMSPNVEEEWMHDHEQGP